MSNKRGKKRELELDTTITFRIPREEKERVEEYAQKHGGASVGSVIREALTKFFETVKNALDGR